MVGEGCPSKVEARSEVTLVRREDVRIRRELRRTLVDDFSGQAGHGVRTAQAEIGLGVLPYFEHAINVVPEAEIQGQAWTDPKVVLPVKTPIAVAQIGLE